MSIRSWRREGAQEAGLTAALSRELASYAVVCVPLFPVFFFFSFLFFHFKIRFIWNAAAAAAKSLQSCPTLCNPIDRSPPGCSVPGILQARILEWVAISSFII